MNNQKIRVIYPAENGSNKALKVLKARAFSPLAHARRKA
jgi:hypothetical protein